MAQLHYLLWGETGDFFMLIIEVFLKWWVFNLQANYSLLVRNAI